jgi:O-antigen ligase
MPHTRDGLSVLLDVLASAYTLAMVAFTGLERGYILPNALFVLFLGVAILQGLRGGYRIRPSRQLIGFALVTVGSLLPVLAGVAANQTLATEHVSRSFQLLVLLALYSGYLDTSWRIHHVAHAATLGFLVAFVVGHLILHRTVEGRAVALYHNPNSAAFWSLFTLIAQWVKQHLRVHPPTGHARLYNFLVGGAAVWLIWASQSRKVLLALALPMVVWFAHRFWRSSFRLPLALASALLVAGAASLAYISLPAHQQQRLVDLVQGLSRGELTERSLINRVEYYRTGIALIDENPILGKGGGAFYELGRERSVRIIKNIDSHSVFLDVYIESGVLGFVSYLGIFLMTFVQLSRSQAPPAIRWQAFAYLGAILAIQFGGSIQLDKYMWVSTVLLAAWATNMATLQVEPDPGPPLQPVTC